MIRGSAVDVHTVPQDSASRTDPAVRRLPRIAEPSSSEFRRRYVALRHPAVFAGLVSAWPALGRWSVDFFRDAYPSVSITTAQVAAGVVVMDRRRGLIHRPEKLAAFVGALHAGARDRYMMTPISELPEALRADAPPPAYLNGTTLQNAKVWIGPSGIVSSLHRDLADNLHAQVSGRKRFTLVAPRQSASVYPNSFFDSVPNGCRVDIEHPDYARFPRLREVETFVADLSPGDVIYIPRGWWHHVRTLDLSISVNFWWAHGVRRLLAQAADYVKRVRRISR